MAFNKTGKGESLGVVKVEVEPTPATKLADFQILTDENGRAVVIKDGKVVGKQG